MRHREKMDENKTNRGLGSGINHNYQTKITPKHLAAGNVSNKIPVFLSDGKTVVFAKSKEDEPRVREFWEKIIRH